MESLRERLRACTHGLHQSLEQTQLMLSMSTGSPSIDDYTQYLLRQFHLNAALEARLDPWLPAALAAQRLVKAQWLRCDLSLLGVSNVDTFSSEAVSYAPKIVSFAHAMGMLYVLEGATLGLQVVRRQLEHGHPATDSAGRFLQAYGAQTGKRWREFLEQLEAMPRECWPEVERGSQEAFTAFIDAFSTRAENGHCLR
jgi:heme oxygenase